MIKTKLLVEQHFHGAYGVNFNTAKSEEILELSKKLLNHGIGGFFPTLATDSIENIKKQIDEIKIAKSLQKGQMAEILGIHLEGIFLNPEKKGIHNEAQFLELNVENYQKIEDDFIKIVTLAPELDKGLIEYLLNKGIKVQAGHCTGGDLKKCTGATHLFNAMSAISHRKTSTPLSALVNDNIYTEVIADGVHLSDEILSLIFKTKPQDKIILIGDTLPIAYSDEKELDFCSKKVYYDGKRATDKNGTIAGSTVLLNDIIKRIKKFEYIENVYTYHDIELEGALYWDESGNILKIEKGDI